MQKFNYENKQYLKKLNELQNEYYSKYVSFFKKYLNVKDSYLDVGCGNGVILSILSEDGYKNGFGCDISKLFITEAKKRGIKNVSVYDGVKFPYKDKSFKVVGSFNVLEHVENPNEFISSQLDLIKKNGYIIVACPNFLSVLFFSNHRRLKGFKNKLNNLRIIIHKLLNKNSTFEVIPPVKNKVFEYDDDAIVVTNIIDLKRCIEKENFEIIYQSGFINYDRPIYKFINKIPFMIYLLPSCFVVARRL